MKRAFGGKFAIAAAGAAMVWTGVVAFSGPARAFDDKPSSLDPLLNVFGLGKDSDEKPAIDFRERPSLVVPKNMDLPPPVPESRNRSANWPSDPDVRRRREAATAARAPRVISLNDRPELTARELQQGRSATRGDSSEICDTRISGTPDCSALTPADKLKQVFSLGSKSDDDFAPGVEPKRDYLTEPPPGYRAPKQVVKATSSGPARAYEAPSASDYARGVNPNKTNDD